MSGGIDARYRVGTSRVDKLVSKRKRVRGTHGVGKLAVLFLFLLIKEIGVDLNAHDSVTVEDMLLVSFPANITA